MRIHDSSTLPSMANCSSEKIMLIGRSSIVSIVAVFHVYILLLKIYVPIRIIVAPS